MLNMKPLSMAVASAAVVLSASTLVAQERQADDGLPTIDVRAVLPSEVRMAPGAASTLSAEDIDQLRPYTLHDAFDFVPGVRTIDDDVLGRRAGIGIRGASSRRSRKVLLLEDGTPINASTYLDSSAHYTPPMERLERVEVLRANGQILHGPLNNHGIVNFRNRQPSAEPETTVELGVGNQNANKRHILHSRTEGDIGLVFAYTGMNADGIFDVEDHQYDDLYASAEWQIDERQSLGMSYTRFRERSHYDESNLTPVEYAIAPRRKLGRFGQVFNTMAVDFTKWDLVHDLQLSDNLSMSSRAFATDLDRPRFTVDPEGVLVGALPDFVYEDPDDRFIAGEQGVMVSRDRHYRTYGIESRMELGGLSTGEIDHQLQWGLRAERQSLDDNRSEGEPGEVLSKNNRGQRSRIVEYYATAASFFVQDVMRFGDWSVTPGLRGEYFTQSEERVGFAADPGPHGPKQTEYNTVWLPGVSVLYSGLEETELFASVQRGYSPAIARTAAGFPLIPEIGVNSQVGFRTDILPGWSLEGALFHNRLSDTIVQLPITIAGQNVVINSGDSTATGVDLGMRFDTAGLIDGPLKGYAQLAWNYTSAEFDGGIVDGNRVPEVPENAGSLTVGMHHSSGWELSVTMSYFGSFFTDPANTRDFIVADEDLETMGPDDYLEIREPVVLGEVPSHTLLSARASYTPEAMSDLTLWAQGRNLTDKEYITDLANGLRPGAERTFILGATIRF